MAPWLRKCVAALPAAAFGAGIGAIVSAFSIPPNDPLVGVLQLLGFMAIISSYASRIAINAAGMQAASLVGLAIWSAIAFSFGLVVIASIGLGFGLAIEAVGQAAAIVAVFAVSPWLCVIALGAAGAFFSMLRRRRLAGASNE